MMSSSSPNRGSKAAGASSRPTSKDGSKKNIWSSLLDSVANGKRLPEKNLLILGTFVGLFFWALLPALVPLGP